MELRDEATSGSPEPTDTTNEALRTPLLIVIVAYGSEDHLQACLDMIGAQLPVIVIDNGGSDRARRICNSLAATYVRPNGNIGFAAAVNVALTQHREPGTDVLLLNPDALLLPAELSRMREELHRTHDLAAIGPRLFDPSGATQKELWPIPTPWSALCGVIGAADRLTHQRFVNGAVLLLRGSAIDSIGTLDERFFLYSEETDWQLRALRAGWRVGVTSDASAIHLSGATSANPVRRQILFNASAELFARKWYGFFGWQLFRMASLLAAIRRLLTARDGEDRLTQRRAITQFWRGPVLYAQTYERIH